MKKVDFTNFPLIQGIDGKIKNLDIRRELADALYTQGRGIIYHALAFKIYNSQDEIELDEEEIKNLMIYIEQFSSPNLIDSFKKIFESQK